MIPRECKRLLEVDTPIAEGTKHSAEETSIRHGHPFTLYPETCRKAMAAAGTERGNYPH